VESTGGEDPGAGAVLEGALGAVGGPARAGRRIGLAGLETD
jgi:hypothetical protein